MLSSESHVHTTDPFAPCNLAKAAENFTSRVQEFQWMDVCLEFLGGKDKVIADLMTGVWMDDITVPFNPFHL
jgi:hypothetical protein